MTFIVYLPLEEVAEDVLGVTASEEVTPLVVFGPRPLPMV